MRKYKWLYIDSLGIKPKLRMVFYLMFILPMLICVYLLSNYVLPQRDVGLDIAAPIIIGVFIGLIGFLVIKEIFDSVGAISTEAKLIAAGDTNRRLNVEREDEIGDLAKALNHLTQNVRSNMDELKTYGEKSNQINLEIQKRVFLFSNLLQISSSISQGEKLEDILKLIVEKSRLLADSDGAYLLYKNEGEDDFYMRISEGANLQHLLGIKIKPAQSIFNKLIRTDKPLILDREHMPSGEQDINESFRKEFKLKNTLALPVYLKGKLTAILGIGNTREPYLYKKDDIELLDILTKQITITLENDILTSRIEKLEIMDALTGLYNESFMRSRLDEEIKRAVLYRRSCAFIILNIDNFREFHQNFGLLQTESALKKTAVLIKDSVTEVDRVGRIGDDKFAVILPERNKRQAQQIAEDIRKKIEFILSQENADRRFVVSIGVSENPLDGVTAEELMLKSRESLKAAKTIKL